MASQASIVTIGGISTRVWQTGEALGRAVLLLHGAVGDAAAHWHEMLAGLSDEFRLIAPDLPGFGKTAAPPVEEYAAYLKWLLALIDHFELEQVVLIGHDFGALLARLFAATIPSRVPVVVLVSGGILPGTAPATRFMLGLPILKNSVIQTAVNSAANPTALRQSVHSAHTDVITEGFLNSVKDNLAGTARVQRLLRLGTLPATRTPALPVMLIWGEDDPVVPLKEGQYLQTRIPNAQISELAECGHFPHLEASDVFLFQVRQFLNTQGRPIQRGRGPGRLKG